MAVVATLVESDGGAGGRAGTGSGGRIDAATTRIATTAPAHVPASTHADPLCIRVVVRTRSRRSPDVACVSSGPASGTRAAIGDNQ